MLSMVYAHVIKAWINSWTLWAHSLGCTRTQAPPCRFPMQNPDMYICLPNDVRMIWDKYKSCRSHEEQFHQEEMQLQCI